MDHNLDFLKASKHARTQEFIDLNIDNYMYPVITKPTRITHTSATLIDNIMVSKELYDCHNIGILILDLSDHLQCLLTLERSKQAPDKSEMLTVRDTSEKALK